MAGLRVQITSATGDPRMARSSSASLRRIFFIASRLGLVRTLLPWLVRYRRMLKERKSKPSLIRPIRVFSLLRDRPLSSSHAPSFSWTASACSRLWHSATKSSA